MKLDDCTLATCDLSRGRLNYQPNLPGNYLFIGLFGALCAFNLGVGIWKRTWGFAAGMCIGLLLEVIGYLGRVKMHDDPFTKPPFVMYLVCLTLAPAFLSGAIYLCLSRIVVAYDQTVSRLKPWQYTTLFMIFDFISLLLQAIGGALAATGDDQARTDKGKNIMIAGLAWQVVSMSIFAIICAHYAWIVKKKSSPSARRFPELTGSRKFKAFLFALGVAFLTIYIRSVFRCVELADGFHSELANDEKAFMILEGAMIGVAAIALSAFHPGIIFGHYWSKCNFSFSGKNDAYITTKEVQDSSMSLNAYPNHV